MFVLNLNTDSFQLPINPFQILCETHDKQTKTYCKRLRVVCPEHFKDDIGKQMKICGFPLIWEKCELKSLDEMLGKDKMFSGGMCSISRNQCPEHKTWEQVIAFVFSRGYLLLYLAGITVVFSECSRSH